jgi:hypothetical protein
MLSNLIGTQSGFYPYEIDYSCMFDSASNSYLSLAAAGSTGYSYGGSYSCWLRRSKIDGTYHTFYSSYNNSDNYFWASIDLDGAMRIQQVYSSSFVMRKISTALFKDTSAWYHIFFRVNTQEATAEDRTVIYVNGVKLTSFSTNQNYSTQNWNFVPMGHNTFTNYVGSYISGSHELDGYLSEVHHLPGQYTDDYDDFGEFKNGIWVPKAFAGTYDNEDSFHLTFADSSNLGDDTSGNGNDLTSNGLGTDHQFPDTPTNTYCIQDTNVSAIGSYIQEGGLENSWPNSNWRSTMMTFGPLKTGKWYWECKLVGSDVDNTQHGIADAGPHSGDIDSSAASWDMYNTPASGSGDSVYTTSNATAYVAYVDKSVSVNPSNIGAASQNDIIQIAFDADANEIWFGVNNTWFNNGSGVGVPSTGAYPTLDSSDGIDVDAHDYVPCFSAYWITGTILYDFGQRGFTYTPPTGFKAMCTANLPEPTLVDPSSAFVDVITYTGTGAELAISSLDFQPDFVWIKNRDAADSHHVYNETLGATNRVEPDTNIAETTNAQTLKSFDSNGFTLGTHVEVNTSGEDYLALCLKKYTNGFDIREYNHPDDVADIAGDTVSHNLGVAPEMMWIKGLSDATRGWSMYHHHLKNKTDPETDYQIPSASGGWVDDVNWWNDTAPDASNFTLGQNPHVNHTVNWKWIAHLFASLDGLLKIGSFVGNGNAAGPYIYCGFRPCAVMIKSDASNAWMYFNDVSQGYNASARPHLAIDIANAESPYATTEIIDFYANGFKVRNSVSRTNYNNVQMAFWAFARQPFKYANAG